MTQPTVSDTQVNNQHTRGPWRADNMRIVGPFTPKGHHGAGVVIAFVEQINRPRHLADAQLIAAAPDMLEALKWAEPYLTALGNQVNASHELDVVIGRLRAAIAKAEGREP